MPRNFALKKIVVFIPRGPNVVARLGAEEAPKTDKYKKTKNFNTWIGGITPSFYNGVEGLLRPTNFTNFRVLSDCELRSELFLEARAIFAILRFIKLIWGRWDSGFLLFVVVGY